MKFLPLAALASTLAAAPALRAQQPAPPPLVTTTGSAEIKVAPDLADLQFEVQVRNADLAVALKEQSARAVKVLAALRTTGLAEKDLKASQVQVSTNYRDRYTDTATVQFYQVEQSFGCTLHDLTKLSEITAQVVSAGATGVTSAMLRTSQLRKYKDEARRQAIIAAKEKAVALATELGAKASRPYTITEGSVNPVYHYNSVSNANNYVAAEGSEADENASGSTFAPGLISINATVSVAFVLV